MSASGMSFTGMEDYYLDPNAFGDSGSGQGSVGGVPPGGGVNGMQPAGGFEFSADFDFDTYLASMDGGDGGEEMGLGA